MLNLENFSKDQLHKIMLELLFSFNYMSILMEDWVKQHCPKKMLTQDFKQIYEAFAIFEAKRIEKTLSQPNSDELERVMQFIKHSHWCAFEHIELEKVSENQLRMRTHDCSACKAVKTLGIELTDCSNTGLKIRQAFVGYVNPNAQVTRVFSPPDIKDVERPENISCEWLISI